MEWEGFGELAPVQFSPSSSGVQFWALKARDRPTTIIEIVHFLELVEFVVHVKV